MTNEEFKILHLSPFNSLNVDQFRLNINYNTLSGTIGEIIGITLQTVPRYTTLSQNDINNVLRQINSVKFIIDNTEIELNIIDSAYYPQGDTLGYPFYFFAVEPFQFPLSIANNNGFPDGSTTNTAYTTTGVRVFLSPFLNNVQFTNSYFNPQISNVTAGRKSISRYKVDRDSITSSASNFEAILNKTATLAEIQDSTYTDTGLSNSRYKGTKTNTANFGGVPPILLGKEFTGESFTLDSTDSEVCLINPSFRVLDKLLHTGPNQLPEYNTVITNITSQINNTTETLIGYTGSFSSSFEPNDIIDIEGELMRVISWSANTRQLEVERGYLKTTNTPHIPAANITKVITNRIFKFDKNNSGVTLQENSKIWVNDSNTVLTTDKYGTVYTSSFC